MIWPKGSRKDPTAGSKQQEIQIEKNWLHPGVREGALYSSSTRWSWLVGCCKILKKTNEASFKFFEQLRDQTLFAVDV